MADPLFCGWYRPSPLPRRRRKPWVRVTPPCATRAEASNLASDHAARQGGGDTCCLEAHRDPNDDKEP